MFFGSFIAGVTLLAAGTMWAKPSTDMPSWNVFRALENWRSGAHSLAMDDPIFTKFVGILMSVVAAAPVALTIGYIAHYDFGVSRLDIRMAALIGAATIAPLVVTLMAIEHFEKNLRKPK